jgi:DNA-directed RNA polymerase specialized sigma24 family protein
MEQMEERRALERLGGADEELARQGLHLLFRQSAPVLVRFVCRDLGEQGEDAHDIVQEVFDRVWRARKRIQFVDGARWHRFLQVVARNCLQDRWRASGRLEPLTEETIGDSSQAPERSLDALRQAAQLQLGMRVADTLWLGLDPSEPDDLRTRRLLASQLFYLRGASFDQTLRLAFGVTDSHDVSARRGLQAVLSEPATMRLLVCRSLSLDRDQVLSIILNPEDPPEPEALNRLTERAMKVRGEEEAVQAIGGWTWREVRGLLGQFRFGSTARGLSSPLHGEFTTEEIDDLSVRSARRLPFESRMSRLLDGIDRAQPPGANALRTAGLWRRLIFEYAYITQLPQKQIVSWLGPAARLAGYHGVTEANVNALISARRLIGQLSEACRQALGDDSDD